MTRLAPIQGRAPAPSLDSDRHRNLAHVQSPAGDKETQASHRGGRSYLTHRSRVPLSRTLEA